MLDIAQIQIVPVENGFFIQCVNADGSGSFNPRLVANSREELATQVKELADQLYTKEPPAQPTQGAVAPPDEAPAVGTAPKV